MLAQMAELKEKGNEAYQAADYSKAVQLYTEGIEIEPTNAALFSNRSAAYLKLGDYGKAKQDAEICIELDGTWSKGWWRKGTAQFENEDYLGAKSTFTQGLTRCPGDENLIAGIEKANKFIAALESVHGPGKAQTEFSPDDPSQRTSETAEEAAANKKESASAKPSSDDKFPGTAQAEIERIKTAPNHYAVLHVSTDANSAQMKKNYYTLARLLHPDKCQLEGAENAMTSVSQAYDTLTNVVKKTLYDQFLSQTGEDNETPNQTYQEWESRQQPVELPKWLSVLLSIKGCGWILALIIFVLLVPFLLGVIIIYAFFFLLCLPVRLVMRVFFPEKYEQMKEERERKRAKLEEEAQDRLYPYV